MTRFLMVTSKILMAVALWSGVLALDIWFGWTKTPVAVPEDTTDFMEYVQNRVTGSSVGNFAMALLSKGSVVDEYVYSIGEPVDGNTLFQIASLSKWVSAWGVLSLVEDGYLGLDDSVTTHLTSWTLPASEFDIDKVTLRRLLSHTAGLTDGFGYGGFLDPADVQSLEASLTRAADGAIGNTGVRVGAPPGEKFQYSGGGYTLLQFLIEEISGRPFNQYMQDEIFAPLDMNQSTFFIDETNQSSVADFYDFEQNIAPHYRYTALAAASLYTTVDDLVRFMQAHINLGGEEGGRQIISNELLTTMQQPHGYWLGGMPIWGLGVSLSASNNQGGFVIGHDGANRPAINTSARLDPATGDGIVILSSGNDSLATFIAEDWSYWHTGNMGRVSVMMGVLYHIPAFLIGSVLIIGLLFWIEFLRRE